MAAAPPTASQLELISSLSQDDIPIKLRCAICSRLAVNAFRLPCCEQAICETCQSTLPSSCPVCEHTPVAAADCKPNKSLRTTIKVFLRTEEKKREASRVKELKDTPPTTPAETPLPPVAAIVESVVTPTPDVKIETPTVAAELATLPESSEAHSHEEVADDDLPLEEQQDIPQASIEEIAPGQEQTEDGVSVVGEENGDQETDQKDGMDLAAVPNMSQTPGFGMGFGFDATAAGGFPNMAMMGQGGDFNQMQMMMAMQNGMAPNAFGGFPMMGMPGMSMDPMAMQNMFMNGGFGAQGMGMAGFDGGVGAGFNNGWNGQQSWNVGQDNFNPNGNFGANNSGYQQHATGYNQGNYGRSNQYNDYQQNGYGNQNQSQGYYGRGRGRGRGNFYGQGRGGQGYAQNDYSHQFQNGTGNVSMSETGSIPTGPKATTASVAPADNVDEFGREVRARSEEKDSDEANESNTKSKDDIAADDETVPTEGAMQQESVSEDVYSHDQAQSDDQGPKPIQTLEEIESASMSRGYQNGGAYNGAGQGGYHGNYQGTGYNTMQPPFVTPKVVDVPINAPKGPKAMRDGLPNTSSLLLRGRGGYSIAGRGGSRTIATVPEPSSVVQNSTHDFEKGVDKDGDRDRERSKSRSRSGSRSRSRERRHRRHHRHRSTSLSDDGKEEERRREKRRRRDKKYDDEDLTDRPESDVAPIEAEPKTLNGESDELDIDRSRSQSPTDSRRSSYRSRRDRDRGDRDRSDRDRSDRDHDRERERDRDGHRKSSSHKHRSSHRSHRDSDRERERSRSRSRDRERDRDSRHRHRHSPKPTTAGSADPAGSSNSLEKDREREEKRREQKEKERQEREREAINKSKYPVTKDPEPALGPKIPSGPRAMTQQNSNSNTNSKGGLEIRGASSKGLSRGQVQQQQPPRRESTSTSPSTLNTAKAVTASASQSQSQTAPNADVHTLEREARNRERLLKEAQRIAGLGMGAGGRKRSRDEVDDSGRKGNPGGRERKIRGRGGSRYEHELDGMDEGDGEKDRVARGESERESGRWA